jgi:hypothetical protein
MSEENKESRVKVEDLPQAEKELTAEEAKEVQGGNGTGALLNVSGTNTWDASRQRTVVKIIDEIIVVAEPGSRAHVK